MSILTNICIFALITTIVVFALAEIRDEDRKKAK